MLIGQFHHSLEDKGRLAIPPSYRQHLGDNPILTRGIETNLNLLPFNTWSNLIANLGTHPLAAQSDREMTRLIAQSASEITFDPQGRLLIPKLLRNWAQLKSKVVIAGSVNWVEIWDLEIYTEYIASLEAKSQEIAASLTQETKPC